MDENPQTSTSQEKTGNDETAKKEIRMQSPPLDWAFNNFLIQINDRMTSKDLAKAKAIFGGEGGLGGRVLEEIETPMELFDVLRRRAFLDRDNLIYLQAMLYNVGRKDLLDLAVDYAHSREDVIHFKSPPPEPANGYRFVEIHVQGADFQKYSRNSLEELRRIVADLMFVPPRFVSVAGVKFSSSVWVTLMVPEIYTEFLEAALQKSKCRNELRNLGVDVVRANGKPIQIHEADQTAAIKADAHASTEDVYQTLLDTERKLENSEVECIKLKRQLQPNSIYFNNLLQGLLIKLVNDVYQEKKVPKLAKQSAFVFYRFTLHQIQSLGYDKELIACLLDAHACIITSRSQEREHIGTTALQLENQELRARLLEMQLLKLRPQSEYMRKMNGFQTKLRQQLQPAIIQQWNIQVQFTDFEIRALKRLSDRLTGEEKQILLSKYSWPEGDQSRDFFCQPGVIFLAELYIKELEETGKDIDFQEFIKRKLTEAKRADLHEEFSQMMSDIPNVSPVIDPHQQRTRTKETLESKSSRDELMETVIQKLDRMETLLLKARSFDESMFGARAFQKDIFADINKPNPLNPYDQFLKRGVTPSSLH